MQSPTLLHYFSILIMNTLPINNLAKKHLRCLATILVVLFLSSFYAAHAQESLPVKDYSVGNQFVYSTSLSPKVENVVADTLINGFRYGIVEITYNDRITRYYMRSTESAIYSYDTTGRRESTVYTFGQGCVDGGGLAGACGYNNALPNTMVLYYGDPNFRSSNATGGYARYLKPYGIIEYSDQYCHMEYSQGHTTRPTEYSGAGWYTVCYPGVSVQLVSGVVKGKPINFNGEPDSFFLRWTASNSIVGFRQTQRLSLKLTNALYGVPASRFGKTSARCSFTVDTSLVDIVGMNTAKGNKPDSIKYINGKALLYCSFSIAPESNDIGYIDIKSKVTKDTTFSLTIDNYAIVPTPIYGMTSGVNLSLRKPETAHLRWASPSSSLNFGQTQRVFFRCSDSTNNRSVAIYGITSVRCKLSLDTSLIDIVGMQTAKGNRPDSILYSGRNTIIHFTFLTDSIKTDIGFMDIHSKSAIDTVLSFVVDNPDIQSAFNPVTTSIFSLSLKKLKLNYYLNNASTSSSVGYGNQQSISFGMQSIFTPSALPPPAYTLSLDTTGLDSIQIVTGNSETPLVPDKVTSSGGRIEYIFSRPSVQSYPFTAGRLRFRSKSLQARDNVLSVFTNNTATGIDYIPTSITLKQTGVGAFGFQPDFVSQLEQGKNLVKHLAPNPATDVLTIRYAMGNSADNVQLELVNMLGIVQKSVTLANYDYGVHDIVMDVSDIAPGIYLLRVRSNGNVETQKVLIGR